MKVLYIDIETTGLSPLDHKMLEFGAMLCDTDIDEPISTFQANLWPDTLSGDPVALKMNADLIHQMLKGEIKCEHPWEASERFSQWLDVMSPYFAPNKLALGGKNIASFDIPFLVRHLPGFSREGIGNTLFGHRTVDPCMLYWDGGDKLPSLKDCCEIVGIKLPTHRTLDDCFCVHQLIRRKVCGTSCSKPTTCAS